MANIDKNLLEQQQAALAAQQNAAAQSTADAVTTPAGAAPTLAGVSDNTQNNLSKYTSGYTPSQSVTQAQEYLNSVISSKPGSYVNQYQNQLDSLYNQVMNLEDFSFDLNGNALYQMYKDKYVNQGKQAMMDTMGQAAALTGGYGNSYATTAGNQAYQAYLQQLNDIVPDLYQMELDRYNRQGEELLNQYELTAGLESDAYGKYRDVVSDWNTERDVANADYLTKYEQDYNNWANMLNFWNQQAQLENENYFQQTQLDMQQEAQNREYAYQQAMAILTQGKMPSAELLTAAGISSADAASLQSAYTKSSGGGGSSKSGSSGGGGNTATQPATEEKSSGYTYAQLVQYMRNQNSDLRNGEVFSESKFIDLVESSYDAGTITEQQATLLLNNASNRR